jgi:hypothetical protein
VDALLAPRRPDEHLLDDHPRATLTNGRPCSVDGQADAANKRITDALGTPEAEQDRGDEDDPDSKPAA